LNKINLVILACVTVSLLYWLPGAGDLMNEYLAFSGAHLLQGRIWTVFTGLFLHADVVHLAGNMILFYVFGNTLENELKAKKTLSAFFVGDPCFSIRRLLLRAVNPPDWRISGNIHFDSRGHASQAPQVLNYLSDAPRTRRHHLLHVQRAGSLPRRAEQRRLHLPRHRVPNRRTLRSSMEQKLRQKPPHNRLPCSSSTSQ
jgi:hypothetical protein